MIHFLALFYGSNIQCSGARATVYIDTFIKNRHVISVSFSTHRVKSFAQFKQPAEVGVIYLYCMIRENIVFDLI